MTETDEARANAEQLETRRSRTKPSAPGALSRGLTLVAAHRRSVLGSGVGPALLVLAAGALVGAIALLVGEPADARRRRPPRRGARDRQRAMREDVSHSRSGSDACCAR